ncbi:restriction endonuclease subunit S [Methanothermococcus sp.]|uniref:restriction endonuclease subunit S n=1 Tax=Methanothermococcus sp. TaxID=2614238 RepID=UPI0025DDD11F|nr:restriction endonuclease subunit S [Methanothermococcus sp.]
MEDLKKGYKNLPKSKICELPNGKTEIGIIPEDWEVVKLGEISFLKGRIGWQGLTTNEYLNDGDYYLVSGVDFKDGKVDWQNCYYVDKKRYEMDKNIQLRNGDLLITKDGTIGKVAFINELPKKATLNSGVFVLRPINNAYYPKFVYYILTSFIFNKFIHTLKAGSTISHLYQKDFILFKFPLPPLPEQQKIAEILSTWDNAIEKLEELINKKIEYKKGLMQKLLSGELRFPEFKEEWEEVRLGDICEIKKGTQLNKLNLLKTGKYPAINGGIDPSGYTNKWNEEENTITISEGGNSCGYVNFIKQKFWCGGHCYALKNLKIDKIDKLFLYQILKHKERRIMKLRVGSGLPNIQKKDLQYFKITLPPLQEQKKIAELLTLQDKEIELLKKKLNLLREQKKGLMQNLLTGRIRVKV